MQNKQTNTNYQRMLKFENSMRATSIPSIQSLISTEPPCAMIAIASSFCTSEENRGFIIIVGSCDATTLVVLVFFDINNCVHTHYSK